MKKIIYSFLVTFFLLITNLAYSNETSNNETFTKLIETTRPDSNIANISDDNGLTALSKLLVWFKSELMTVVGIFVI
ncbi:MAG: hypothetical protein LBQ59_00905 [Candidatus Peribacteria bacterium]|jgi:hypothetical protein|nr:hypothetical protein [Candidatus Peribacteria bacterium]